MTLSLVSVDLLGWLMNSGRTFLFTGLVLQHADGEVPGVSRGLEGLPLSL